MEDEKAKIKVEYNNGEIEIIGNRAGLNWLSDACAGLADLTAEEAKTAANHYHILAGVGPGTEDTLDAIILFKPDL